RAERRQERRHRPNATAPPRERQDLTEQEGGLRRGPRREESDDELRTEPAGERPPGGEEQRERVALDGAWPEGRLDDVGRAVGGVRQGADERIEDRAVDRHVEAALRDAVR